MINTNGQRIKVTQGKNDDETLWTLAMFHMYYQGHMA